MAFPLSVTQYLHLNMTSRSAKKEEIQQEGSRCRRKMVNFDHAAPSQSLSVYFEQMTKNMYHCKDSRKIYLLSLSLSLSLSLLMLMLMTMTMETVFKKIFYDRGSV